MTKKDDYNNHLKNDSRNREYTQEEYELLLQDANNLLNDTERMIARTEAKMTVSKKKKYMFMISFQMMVFLMIIGGFILLFAVVYASDCISLRHNTKAAVIAVGFAVAVEGLFIFWILKSLKLKKEFDSDVERTLISGDYEHIISSHTQKKSKNVELKYRIELLEKLSKNELFEAEDEWDSLYNTITDSFYRFSSDYYTCIKNNKLYKYFIEIRYENGYPDSEKIKLLEEKVSKEIESIEDFDLSRQMYPFKEKIKEIVSRYYSQYVSDIKLKEVCVAVVPVN
ncbi:MAG: hypothetical protein IKP88_18820 [Lachnospiraceae bacterium]|nr:hypothetical protein [Lachnospiraceae bacterium]